MKVIGAFTAWGCQDFATKALLNHLKICDVIYINVSAHSPRMERFADKTLSDVRNLASKMPDRLKMVRNQEQASNPDITKCRILNEILNYADPGDVLMLCDADEFYSEDSVEELMLEFAKDDWDMLRVFDRFFCINLWHYVNSSHGRFWRISARSKFYPTQNMSPSAENIKTVLADAPMFHYSLLTNLAMRREFWRSEERYMQVDWLNKIYQKWPYPFKMDKIKKLAELNYQITGNRGFWFNAGVDELSSAPYLKTFDGQHPKEIQESDLVFREDFRV